MLRVLGKLVVFCLAVGVGSAYAQAPREARVLVTVVDPTGGMIPGATVVLVGLEDATKAVAIPPGRTTDRGLATFDAVRLGRYSIRAEFAGFDLGIVRDIRFNAGDNRRVVVLPFRNVQESVTVGGGQDAAAARSTTAFGQALTASEISALSDDPSELQRQITELGGSDAIIRVDSFEGAQLPPRSQIKSIHVTRDQFAAETEQPGATFVDVITQAGIGALRGTANYQFRDGRTDGRNPFLQAGTQTPAQFRNFGFNIGGAVIKDKADFSLSVNGNTNYTFPILNANRVTGAPARVMSQRQQNQFTNVNALFNYSLMRDQTLRLAYSQQDFKFTGGFGGYDDLERAYTQDGTTRGVRLMEAGPIGRRTFINSRLSVNWDEYVTRSAVERPTIMVLDYMTTGGAQSAGGTRSRNFTLESDVDHVRGIHSFRTGIKVVGGSFSTDERNNYLGTYTFSSVDDFNAGKPSLYTIETGDPSFSYFNLQGAVYFQDDIRVSKSLTLSPGIRYSAQKRIKDPGAIEPRFGATWAPFASGRTTIRASGGSFHGWLGTFVLAQAIRLDGTHQRQVVVRNPTYPDPGSSGTVTPPNKFQIGAYQLNQNVRYSAGVDQVLTPKVRISVIYSYIHVRQLPRGMNLNPLINGVRADPTVANVIATVTDAELRRHDLNTTFNINLAAGAPANAAALFNWRRVTINGGYSALLPKRSGVGPFDVPPSGSLEDEWGRGPAHQRYVVNAAVTSTQVRNLTVNVNLNIGDGFVYHQTTGTDDNRDGILNDRVPGVGLWSLRTDGRETVNMRVQYNLALGGASGGPQARYRLSPFVQINNLTNHANYTGYSGVLTSSDYAKPTRIQNPRTIQTGMNLSF